jgi:mRNA-degrading endonuclease RelE of RelBE toxin-antitoxin system
MFPYRLLYSRTSREHIRKIHPELKSIIRARIKKLINNPYFGKKLEKELSGYFSLRAKRFRILYKIHEKNRTVEIHYVGHRKDVYQLFREYVESR